MNAYHAALIIQLGMFATLSVFTFARFLYNFRSGARKHLLYTICAVGSICFIAFQLQSSLPGTDIASLWHARGKSLSIIIVFLSWVMLIRKLFFQKNGLPWVLIAIYGMFTMSIPFDFFFHLPVRTIEWSFFGLPVLYRSPTTGALYQMLGIFTLGVCIYYTVRVLFTRQSVLLKTAGIASFIPGFAGLHDALVQGGVYRAPYLSDQVFFVYILIGIFFFIREEEIYIGTITRMNQELDVKVKNRTRELEETNEKLLRASASDPLTGLYNRTELRRRLTEEISRQNRYGASRNARFSVIIADFDHFGYYNTTFGHSGGDMLLRAAASNLKTLLRNSDTIARFGSDEFAVILMETSLEGAKQFAARYRDRLFIGQNYRPELEGHTGRKLVIPPEMRLTMSIGIAEFTAGADTDGDTLLSRADRAMRHARKTGGDRCTVWENAIG